MRNDFMFLVESKKKKKKVVLWERKCLLEKKVWNNDFTCTFSKLRPGGLSQALCSTVYCCLLVFLSCRKQRRR